MNVFGLNCFSMSFLYGILLDTTECTVVPVAKRYGFWNRVLIYTYSYLNIKY